MATAAVARSANALRSRRDPPRTTLPLKRSSAALADGSAINIEPASKRQKPHVVTKEYILNKFRDKPPSLIVHLHPTFFRFDGQDNTFTYDSPWRHFLVNLRSETLPHDMLEELHAANIPFYDGHLIVEVHNHRSAADKDKSRRDATNQPDQIRYGMHNYNPYVTPSPFVPYPKKANENEAPPKIEPADTERPKGDQSKEKNGPHISTIVMFSTPHSLHRDMLILANTPMEQMRTKKRNADGTTPSSALPTTPQLGAPPSLNVSGQDKQMCLEEQDFYQFQADVLVTSEPPLYLNPVRTPQEAQKVLDMLAHPLHSHPPPSPKSRKRTSAEMAADDAQFAETEHRMLTMDSRIKSMPSGTGDNASTAQNTAFSRFKTMQMVREKLEEDERRKREEEQQAAQIRKQAEEAERAAEQTRVAQQEKQKQLLMSRQNQARAVERMRQQQQAQAAAVAAAAQMNQAQPHPQQNNMMQSAGFPHSGPMVQSSPVVRQPTPMINNSSPMLQQNGFGMTANASQQGAGSPPRPTPAMPNPNLAMARQASQQQGSRIATPQMNQGTPHMAGAVPNRGLSQTPRMQHGSPAPGTPVSLNMPNMAVQTAGNGFTQAQMAMLEQQQRQMSAGSPGQTITPEQMSAIRQRQQQQQHFIAQAQAQAAQQGQNPQLMQQQRQALLMRQQHQQVLQQRMMQQQNAQQAGSPHHGIQQNPQMAQMHPQQGASDQQQMTTQQQQQRAIAQHQLGQLIKQYGRWQNIPSQVLQSLSPIAQSMIRSQVQKQQQTMQAQQMQLRAQQSGQQMAGNGSPDPAYMQTLRDHQARLAATQVQQGGMHNMDFGNNSMQNQHDLTQSFQAMQQALQRGQQGGGMGGQ